MLLLLLSCHLFDAPDIGTCADFNACGGDDSGPGVDDTDEDDDGVPASTDCDDSDPDIGGPETVWTDADGDGYGDPDTETETCDIASDQVYEAGDCDDTTAEAAPGLDEVCGDGLDNDCDGTANGCRPEGTYTTDEAAAVVTSGMSYPYVGASVAILGDTDGDGHGEFAVGVPYESNFDGSVAIWDIQLAEGRWDEAEAILYATTYGGVGYSLAATGDVDGDGIADVLVGEPYSNEYAGAAALFYGPLSGKMTTSDNSAVFVGSNTYTYLSQALGVGDLDGDGDIELLLGGRSVAGGQGGVYVLDGPQPVAGNSVEVVDNAIGLISSTDGGTFGAQISNAVDMDQDGADDVVIADYKLNGGAGAAFVFTGPISGDITTSDSTCTLVGSTSDYLGYTGPSGVPDMDGDGYPELAVGGYNGEGEVEGAGRAYLVDGPPGSGNIASIAVATILGENLYGYFGRQVSGTDIDADGIGDLVVSSPYNTADGTTYAGTVHVFYGPLSGTYLQSSADITIQRAEASYGFGEVIATGDADLDGHGDILIGHPGWDGGRGDASLFLGSSY